MFETLQKYLVRRRVSGNSSPPVEHQLDLESRAHLRKTLDSPGWAALEQRFLQNWLASVNRLITESDPAKLEALQAEVRVWEKVLAIPRRLLENTNMEHN